MKSRLLKNGQLILDGAMGTMLQKYGLGLGQIPEDYNVEKPDIIKRIHREYIDAGADVITTNTFGANERKLKRSKYEVEDVISAAVSIAKEAAEGQALVALDIGPVGELMEPMGTLDFESAYDIFKRQVIAGAKAGCDLVLIETISDLYEAKAAILAAKENSTLPVICTMTFEGNGRTFSGNDIASAMSVICGLEPFAAGFNCSAGPDELLKFAGHAVKFCNLEMAIQPNAGLPEIVDKETVYRLTPDEFAEKMAGIRRLGVRILGGCCGTTPSHIRRLREKLEGEVFEEREKKEVVQILTSGSKPLELSNKIYPVGERINPTGNKGIRRAIVEGDYDYILKEAVCQQEEGASIIDINLGLPQVDEVQMMNRVIRQVQSISTMPIQIDSSDPRVIEEGLRIIKGNAIVNSVNGKRTSMERIFPLIKKYGAFVVGLTLDEGGIPSSWRDRLEIARRIVERAKEYGIGKDRIIIDPLVLTVSAQQDEAMDTIKAIGKIEEELGVKTALGISNISFGLPNRQLLNSGFLAGALANGLNLPIVNTKDAAIMDTISSYDVLRGADRGAFEYIKKYSKQEKRVQVKGASYDLETSIVKGMESEALLALQEKMDENKDLVEIVNEYIIPALDIVGEKYESQEIFLPQLIRSAEVAKACFGRIKECFSKDQVKDSCAGKIILATVKGDIHDIGKNIVRLILENYGYKVIDLGKDVDEQLIVKTAIEEDVRLIGLSALMTTTVVSMESAIGLIREKKPDAKVFVGGAVLNPEYAKEIGADFYAKDAKKSIEIARSVFAS